MRRTHGCGAGSAPNDGLVCPTVECMPKTWIITGASRGFGRLWAQAALERGDRVALTARKQADVEDLVERFGENRALALTLDVRDRAAAFAAVRSATAHFGRLDVVVNNAGYGLFGAIEEVTEADARRQIDTNLLGALWVTQAALPVLREQGAGHLLQVTSEGGVFAYPGIGVYHASKWGVEGFSQSLAGEVAHLGIKVTMLEPGPYATGFGDAAATAEPLAAYESVRAANQELFAKPGVLGDPTATIGPLMEVVDAAEPPLRVLFGATPLGRIRDDYADRLATWEKGEDLARRAHGLPLPS